jgi:N-terminal domain of anti-restriction factor ArdC
VATTRNTTKRSGKTSRKRTPTRATPGTARRSGPGTSRSGEEREALLDKARADFEARLTAMAADPAQWVTFIQTVAEWGARYSLSNQLLLMMQALQREMEPTYFLPYGKKDGSTGWLKHGRQVRAGEKSFKVWAPVKRRPTQDEVDELEAAGRKVRRDPDGRPSIQVVAFTLASTFDLVQTDGKPFQVPTVAYVRRQRLSAAGVPHLLTGDDPTDAFDDIAELIKDAGYSFDLAAPGSPHLGTANGVTVGGDVMLVRVRDDVDPAQRLKTTVHELAHIRCEHLTGTRIGENLHRGRRETEAESVAHIVCAALGLNTAAYSDAYVLGWANGDIDLVRQCATTVLRVAKHILADLTAGGEPAPDSDHTDDDGDPGMDPTSLPSLDEGTRQ